MSTAKSATPKTTTEKNNKEVPNITTTKTATCKTLNGQSKLDYALGRDAKGGLYYRITKNSGGGFYSDEWLAADSIQAALAKKTPITSTLLRSLSVGKSVNTCGFLLAVLLAEKVVEYIPGKTRHFQLPGKSGTAGVTPKKAPAKRPTKPARAKQH